VAKKAAAVAGGTRYARVKQILDKAARGSTSDYGGNPRFWQASLDELKVVCVYGVRMIAPESSGSSCGCGEGNGESRSARSGLIQGLRGAPPFDGVRFPPLMWGGDRVGDDDVAFIADWIDDGCPADDGVRVLEAKGESTIEPRVELDDVKEFGAMEWPDWIASRPGTPRQRGNLDCLSETQLERLRQAFRCIYDLDDHVEDRRNYNNQALIHQNHCQHGWERFLPWHRAYLYEFEQNLQDFFPRLTLPYWDWAAEKYQPTDKSLGNVLPDSFKAFLTEEQARKLVGELKPKPEGDQRKAFLALGRNRTLFTTQHQFFCYVIKTIGYRHVKPDEKDFNRNRMIDALLASNALWYPLRYSAEFGGKTIETKFGMHFPSGEDMKEIQALNNFRDFGGGSIYDAAFGFLDQNPHNTMHIWTGGLNPDADQKDYVCDPPKALKARRGDDAQRIAPARRNEATRVAGRKFHSRPDLYTQPGVGDMLSNLTASYDPVFWPIHVNIDRAWWEWQKRNPSGVPFDLDSVLSPWNYTIRDTLDVARFGYEYVRGSFFMPVGLEAPIARFVSKPIPIAANLKAFSRAEIRLHWVPQLQRSCFVRAFLNDPAASSETPLHDNPHFAGYLAIFGHGPCYGGPGHCDPPPPSPRDYDWRTRSHNTPRNHRIDVTKSARKLLEKSDELRITLLVIGADYEEDPDLLKLEGASLSLFD